MPVGFRLVNLKERDHLEGLVVDGRVILNGCERNRMGGSGLDLCGSKWRQLAGS
jgi:hypothetical protein